MRQISLTMKWQEFEPTGSGITGFCDKILAFGDRLR